MHRKAESARENKIASLQKRHRFFLASSWNTPELRTLRKSLWSAYNRDERGGIWIAESERPDLNPEEGIDQLEIIDICLDAIEATEAFFLLDTGEYGSHLHVRGQPSELSFLELELFQAALLGKPIYYLLVGQAKRRTQLQGLVETLERTVYVEYVRTLGDAEAHIRSVLDATETRSRRSANKVARRLSGTLIKQRHFDWSNQRLFSEPQFLHGTICGATRQSADLDVARHYLGLADEQSQTNRILSRTWIAMRALMFDHFSETKDPTIVELWDRALRTWSRAAAWRGLHGHLWLGNVAALGSLAALRLRSESPLYDPRTPNTGDLYDSLASVYYSISKRVPVGLKPAMLARSAAYVEEGLHSRDENLRGTLLPIRGSINHQRRRFLAAARDFSDALDLAVKQDASPDQIGFLMTELGFAELFLLKPKRARQRIEEGLRFMTPETSSPGFRVRALRKHIRASLACLDLVSARESATSALAVALEHRLYDQIDPLVLRLAENAQSDD